MTQPRRRRTTVPQLPPGFEGINQELADAFSDAVFGLLDHNCSCPSAKFVKLLVKYRKTAFKGVSDAIPDNSFEKD